MHSEDHEEPPTSEPGSTSEPRSRFPTTRWTLIRRIVEGDPTQRGDALEEVCRIYWPPIYAYFRSRGTNDHEAQDLTQSFFARLLEGGAMERLDPNRGKLRAYLLQSAKHFHLSAGRRKNRAIRGGGAPALSVDPAKLEALRGFLAESGGDSPDTLFDRMWAETVMETTYERVARRYREAGKSELFEAISAVIRPDGGTYDAAAASARLGVSEPTLRVAVHRLRRAYGATLRQTVSETLAPGEDLEEELRQLRASFQ